MMQTLTSTENQLNAEEPFSCCKNLFSLSRWFFVVVVAFWFLFFATLSMMASLPEILQIIKPFPKSEQRYGTF